MSDAERITRALGGHWHGRYGLALCPAHENTATPSLSLSDGHEGRLLAKCFAGCGFAEILSALRARGLAGGSVGAASRDASLAPARRAVEAAHIEKRAAQARRLWAETVPIAGTTAEAYLRGRGITCGLPQTLRFHPDCWHRTAKWLPALVAIVECGDTFAVHRTYLAADGSGKTEAEPAKAMLGAVAGGAVRLSDGDGALVVAEGIETALSLCSGLLSSPATVWAALSASGMRRLLLPDIPGRLVVAADGDAAGREAAISLGDRARGLGWKVSIRPAPDGMDWNDVLVGKAVAA
jgi:hypothetical protein